MWKGQPAPRIMATSMSSGPRQRLHRAFARPHPQDRRTLVPSALRRCSRVPLTDKTLREGAHPGDLFLRVAIVDSTVIDELP
jgi:hypothetical protein